VENGRAGGSGSGLRQVAPASSSSALDMTLESFVVGPSNRLAFNAALQLLDSPGNLYNPFFVHGPPGVGKTHLLKGLCHAFRHRRRGPKDVARSPSGVETTAGQGFACRVRYLSGEQFFNQFAASVQDGTVRKFRERYRSLDVLIVDDVHLLVNKKKTQVEFLHTFNSLAETGRQVILASDAPPKSLGDLDRGLVGRFLSGLVVGIKKPDYETRLGIASMQARRFTTRFDESVLRFLAERVRGSARELIGAMKQVDIHAQLNGGALSLRQAEEALAELIREEERRVTLSRIVVVVAAHFRLSPEVLVSPSRQRHVALARQTGMFLARQYTGKSLGEIGKHFGNRNHTTVRCALAKVERLLTQSGDRLVWEISQIRETLEQ
jgi:chromosomal replication initiator protein